jgi:hypothetical protein
MMEADALSHSRSDPPCPPPPSCTSTGDRGGGSGLDCVGARQRQPARRNPPSRRLPDLVGTRSARLQELAPRRLRPRVRTSSTASARSIRSASSASASSATAACRVWSLSLSPPELAAAVRLACRAIDRFGRCTDYCNGCCLWTRCVLGWGTP